MHSLSVQRLILMVIGCAPIILASIAHAASNTDPFTYDPQFNNGVILEDRFASTTTSTSIQGQRVLVSPHYIGDPNGDIVASGLVAAAYQGSPGNNFGSVRYSSSGQRISWGDPDTGLSFYSNIYVDYPNNSSGNVYRVDDAKEFMGYIFALHDTINSSGTRDVRILQLVDGGPNTVNGGKFLSNIGAFTTPSDETGAALVPYTYPTYDGTGNQITAYRLIAVATYTNSIGQQIITMKRFILDIATGALTVDNSFGISNNGAMDQIAPNWMCNAGAYCSWEVTAVTALRTNTSNPTLYLGVTAYDRPLGRDYDGVVVAINGSNGSLGNLGDPLSEGIYVDQTINIPSSVEALAATTSGTIASDVIYVTSSEKYTSSICQAYPAKVIKLLAQTTVSPGVMGTAPDNGFANSGVLRFGGELTGCVYSTFPVDMLVDGNRLVIVGAETHYTSATSSTPTEPLFAIVRTSDGALTDYQRGAFSPLHADGTPWGAGAFTSVALRSAGHYAVTGAIFDASANSAALFGTAAIASDRIFGNSFESP